MLPAAPTQDPKTARHTQRKAGCVLGVLTLLAMGAAASLGAWQLQRASTKEQLAAQIEERNRLPALINIAQAAIKKEADGQVNGQANEALSQAIPDDSAQTLVYRRAQLRGTWLAAHTVFLDNRYMAGKPGFFVVTPLQLEPAPGQAAPAAPSVVWVQRGWVARDPLERSRLPVVATPVGTVAVQGRVVESVSRVYELGDAQRSASAPLAAGASRIWQNLPHVDLGRPVQWHSVALLQTVPSGQVYERGSQQRNEPSSGPDSDGLLRDWPAVDAGVAKHYGYAFQWFALCGLIMVLYVWFQLISHRRRKA